MPGVCFADLLVTSFCAVCSCSKLQLDILGPHVNYWTLQAWTNRHFSYQVKPHGFGLPDELTNLQPKCITNKIYPDYKRCWKCCMLLCMHYWYLCKKFPFACWKFSLETEYTWNLKLWFSAKGIWKCSSITIIHSIFSSVSTRYFDCVYKQCDN
jgi:hypothetical protein